VSAPSGSDLRAKVIASIQKAKNVADLGAVGDLLEVRVSEGRISAEEHAEFLGLMNARHQEIEPEVAADA
jgi:hypothetical protein